MLAPQSSVHDVSLVATGAWRCIAFNGMEVSLAGLDNDAGVRKVEDHDVAPNRRSVMAMNNHATLLVVPQCKSPNAEAVFGRCTSGSDVTCGDFVRSSITHQSTKAAHQL